MCKGRRALLLSYEWSRKRLAERKYDKKLRIRTTGIREWGKEAKAYNRYEPTPYRALEKLFTQYKLSQEDRVVDFGSGRGRVAFYVHHRFNIPVTGVEANDRTIDEAFVNKKQYRTKRQHLKAPISFQFALAEQYEIEETDTCFYFFNPFSLKVFKQVVHNILRSVEQYERKVELILYYPLPEFKVYLQQQTRFKIINKVMTQGEHGKYGKFVIYRLKPQRNEQCVEQMKRES